VNDPGEGRAEPPVTIPSAAIDTTGPRLVTQSVLTALGRYFGGGELRGMEGLADDSASLAAVDAYQRGALAVVLGDYERSEQLAREAIERDPTRPGPWSILGCALSFLGRDAEARRAIERAKALLGNAQTRLEHLTVEQDIVWLEAERARAAHDQDALRRRAAKLIELDYELAYGYAFPVAFLYLATIYQYFLDDLATARRIFADARNRFPALFPAYSEEARLLLGDPRTRPEAARLVWTYVRCFESSPMAGKARGKAIEWSLPEPAAPLTCPDGSRR